MDVLKEERDNKVIIFHKERDSVCLGHLVLVL